jgi:hypothetical protein
LAQAAGLEETAIRNLIKSINDLIAARQQLDRLGRGAATPDGSTATRNPSGSTTTDGATAGGATAQRRAGGGPTRVGGVYQINEYRHPEVYEEAGRQYLLPAADGRVTPLAALPAAAMSAMTHNVNVNAAAHIPDHVMVRFARVVSREMRHAGRAA